MTVCRLSLPSRASSLEHTPSSTTTLRIWDLVGSGCEDLLLIRGPAHSCLQRSAAFTRLFIVCWETTQGPGQALYEAMSTPPSAAAAPGEMQQIQQHWGSQYSPPQQALPKLMSL